MRGSPTHARSVGAWVSKTRTRKPANVMSDMRIAPSRGRALEGKGQDGSCCCSEVSAWAVRDVYGTCAPLLVLDVLPVHLDCAHRFLGADHDHRHGNRVQWRERQ